jgi:uncharacterized protein YjbI with pentapeptide repeats
MDRTTFVGATFSGWADFPNAQFSGSALFGGAHFADLAGFYGARFWDEARFGGTEFLGRADFNEARFSHRTQFTRAHFSALARFHAARFAGNTDFDGAEFSGTASLSGARFSALVHFRGAGFRSGVSLGPLVALGGLILDNSVFDEDMTARVSAPVTSCRFTRFERRAELHTRWVEIALDGATFGEGSRLAGAGLFLQGGCAVVPETGLDGRLRGRPAEELWRADQRRLPVCERPRLLSV